MDELSARELEILRLLATGLSHTQIMAQLHITKSTVKTYVYRMYNKMDAVNAAHAVARGYQLGILGCGE